MFKYSIERCIFAILILILIVIGTEKTMGSTGFDSKSN